MGPAWADSNCAEMQIVEDTFADVMVFAKDRLDETAARDFSGDDALRCERLTPDDAASVESLVTRTNPGPFSPRAIELGVFYGVKAKGRIVAVAGTRFETARVEEIATVCSDPAHEGRGHARRLVGLLVKEILGKRKTPFLHVLDRHDRAARLYEKMGFVTIRRAPVKAFRRIA